MTKLGGCTLYSNTHRKAKEIIWFQVPTTGALTHREALRSKLEADEVLASNCEVVARLPVVLKQGTTRSINF